jgi:hypothetical protein
LRRSALGGLGRCGLRTARATAADDGGWRLLGLCVVSGRGVGHHRLRKLDLHRCRRDTLAVRLMIAIAPTVAMLAAAVVEGADPRTLLVVPLATLAFAVGRRLAILLVATILTVVAAVGLTALAAILRIWLRPIGRILLLAIAATPFILASLGLTPFILASFGLAAFILASLGLTPFILASLGLTPFILASFGLAAFILASFGLAAILLASFGLAAILLASFRLAAILLAAILPVIVATRLLTLDLLVAREAVQLTAAFLAILGAAEIRARIAVGAEAPVGIGALLLGLLLLRRSNDAVIMLGVLEIVLRYDPVARGRRITRELQVFFVNLESAAADTDVWTIRIERLHTQRYIGAAAAIATIVGIIVVIPPARPFGVGTLSHPANLLSLPVSAIR